MPDYVDKEGFVLENIGVSRDLDGEIIFALYNGNKIEILHTLYYSGKIYHRFKAADVSGPIPETFKDYNEEEFFWVLSKGNAKKIFDNCIHTGDIELHRRYNPDTGLISRAIRLPVPEEKVFETIDVLREMGLTDYSLSFKK